MWNLLFINIIVYYSMRTIIITGYYQIRIIICACYEPIVYFITPESFVNPIFIASGSSER